MKTLACLLVAFCACTEKPKHLTWLEAPASGEVARVVRDAAVTARQQGQTLLVYVGATWCEPCERFHQAAARGELDRDFAELRLLVFDADRDRERLAAAGYASNLIPLLVVPQPDGTASNKRMQGSIKGSGAVAEMTPRLRELLR